MESNRISLIIPIHVNWSFIHYRFHTKCIQTVESEFELLTFDKWNSTRSVSILEQIVFQSHRHRFIVLFFQIQWCIFVYLIYIESIKSIVFNVCSCLYVTWNVTRNVNVLHCIVDKKNFDRYSWNSIIKIRCMSFITIILLLSSSVSLK